MNLDEPSIDPPASQTVIRRINGAIHVQHFGPEHVLRGSERVIDLLPGCTVVIRHVPESPADG